MGLLGAIGTAVGSFTGMPWLGAVGAGLDSFVDKGDSARSQGEANEFNAKQAQINRDFQDAQAKRQMDFQERMRGSQYQTAVKDMQAAGLNPMLAYSQGGAGTPSGSAGSGSLSAPALNKVSAGMASAAQSAQVSQALQAVEASKAQIDQIRAQTDQIKSETVDQNLNSAFKAAQVRSLMSGSANTEQDTKGKALTYQLDKDSFQALLQSRQVAAQRAGQDYSRETETFGADVAKRKAEATLTQMEIPKSAADAKFWQDFKDAPQILKLIMQNVVILPIMRH